MRPGNPKITKTNPKKVHQPLLPLRRGEKTTTKIQSVMQPTRRTTPHQWFKHHPTSTHQKRRISHTNQPNKKSLAHYRVLTQHTHTQTHPKNKARSKRLNRPYTHPHNKQNRLPCKANERIHQRSFSYRHLTRTTVRRGVVGHADSHKATHTQPTTQTSRLLQLFKPFDLCVSG